MLRQCTLALLSSSLVLAPGSPALSQEVAPEVGKPMRLFLQGEAGPMEGTLSSVTSSGWTLSFEDGDSRTFDREDVIRAEVLQNNRNTMKGAMIGGGVGLVVGVIGASSNEDSCDGAFLEDLCDSLTGIYLIGTPVLGAGIGALVGALIKTEGWVPAFEAGSARGPGSFSLSWSVPVGG